YCSRMAKPSIEKSSYLQTIGDGLHTDIDIFWTDDNQKHSSVFMSGDEESWSKRGGIAGDFLACFVFLLNIS
ncbi:unnamed protein product, partial [Rotaria sp. Silwood2]